MIPCFPLKRQKEAFFDGFPKKEMVLTDFPILHHVEYEYVAMILAVKPFGFLLALLQRKTFFEKG